MARVLLAFLHTYETCVTLNCRSSDLHFKIVCFRKNGCFLTSAALHTQVIMYDTLELVGEFNKHVS